MFPPNYVSALTGGHDQAVLALSLSSSNVLASGGDCICLWSPSEKSEPVLRIPEQEACAALLFSVGRPELLYGACGCRIVQWDTRQCSQPLTSWMVNEEEINSLDLLESESRLASADDKGDVKIIDTTTGQVVRSLHKHENICSAVRFRPNRSNQVISGGLDSRLIVSDWKGTGLGVIIFEMSDLVELEYPTTFTVGATASAAAGTATQGTGGDSSGMGHSLMSGSSSSSTTSSSSSTTSTSTSSPSTSISGVGPPAGVPVGSAPDSDNEDADDRDEEQDEEHQLEQEGEEDFTEENDEDMMLMATSTTAPDASSATSGNQPQQSVTFFLPPMVHSLACTSTGSYVACGLQTTTIELFSGAGKYLTHVESLYGHTRGVASLLCVQDSHLVSGGNDGQLFVWQLSPEGSGRQFFHGEKISQLEGRQMDRIYIADHSETIQVIDLIAS